MHRLFPSNYIQSRNTCPYPLQHKDYELSVSLGLVFAWLFVSMQEKEGGNIPFFHCLFFFFFKLSSDIRAHHNFCFKDYSIFSFHLTEPVEKGLNHRIAYVGRDLQDHIVQPLR